MHTPPVDRTAFRVYDIPMTKRMSEPYNIKSERWMCWCWLTHRKEAAYCPHCLDFHAGNFQGKEKTGWDAHQSKLKR